MKMGEQPIFSTKAHVFQIDPNTKKKWLPVSSQAVSVAYYHDSTRNTYRIISVDGSKAVINSTIMPNMTFTKTSQKFGQWSDSRANTVYGLGFPSEAELAKFIEKFKEVKELTRQAAQTTGTTNQPSAELPPISASPGQTNGTDTNNVSNHIKVEPPETASPVNSPRPMSTSTPPIQNDVSGVDRHPSSSSSPSLPSSQPSSQLVEQLKYENDRLKIALAQSSANAKKWEVELQTLKNNNARLTTALQESTSNVEQWKKQLATYKEESVRLKKKVVDLEKGGGSSELLQRQLTDTREKLTELEQTLHDKQDEIIGLKSQLDISKPVQEQNRKLQEKIQALEQEKVVINAKLTEQQQKLESLNNAHNRERQQLRTLQQQLGNKLSDVYELNDKFAELTQS